MSTITIILAFLLPVAAIVYSVFSGIKEMKRTGSGKKAFKRHLITLVVCLVLCFSLTAFVSAETAPTPSDAVAVSEETAAEPVETEAEAASNNGAGTAVGLGFIGAALSIGLAGIGGGIALSAGAPAAIGAVAEDPSSFGKAIIFVALGEAVAIYGLIIAFLIVLKLPTITL